MINKKCELCGKIIESFKCTCDRDYQRGSISVVSGKHLKDFHGWSWDVVFELFTHK